MTIKNLCKTPVEIYRDGKKILNSKAHVQEGIIYFTNAKVNQLDIIKVIPTKEGFEVINHPHIRLHPITNQILYIKAKVRRS